VVCSREEDQCGVASSPGPSHVFNVARVTLRTWDGPGDEASVVLEWREWLELAANWKRVRHGCMVQMSVELVMIIIIDLTCCLV
jgi:hypothetical protein